MSDSSRDPDKTNELATLVAAYCHGDLTEAEIARLEQLLLDDPQARAFFRRYLGLDAALHEYSQSAAPHWRAGEPGAPFTADPPANRRRKSFWWKMAGIAAALLVVVGALLTFTLRDGYQSMVIGTLEQATGDVRVLAADGTVQSIASQGTLKSGDTVRTRGTESSTVVAYPDGTRLTLVGNTSVTCGERGSKNLVIHQGTLAASVRPQPRDTPMVLSTPSALVQVLGTRFLIEAVENRTDLSVSQGRVRLVRVSDGEGVDVADGKHAAVTAQNKLVVADIPRPPSSWHHDFEAGFGGWDQGERITAGLPVGSRGGLKAVPEETDEGGHYKLRSGDGWLAGLFVIEPASHLHLTFKIDRPGWINVFIVTRTPAPDDASFAGNFMFNDFPMIEPGKWHTATIPLSNFQRQHRGTKKLEELVPYRLVLTSSDDGLVLDRIWLTADGPGEVELNVVE